MSTWKIIGIIVFIVVGLFFFTRTQQKPPGPEEPHNQKTPVDETSEAEPSDRGDVPPANVELVTTDETSEAEPSDRGDVSSTDVENNLGEHNGVESDESQQELAKAAYTIFEQHCLDCHGEFGYYADTLVIQHEKLIEKESVIPGKPDGSELYTRLLEDTAGTRMPQDRDPLDSEAIATIRRWIEAGAPDWEAIPKPERHFITTEEMLKTIHIHVTSLTEFDRSFARYFTLTHLYNAGASDDNLRAYRNALSKLVNSLSWGKRIKNPTPIDLDIDPEGTIFYIDLRDYQWDYEMDSKGDPWYKIRQAYPYSINFTFLTYKTLCQETNCEVPFVRADWFIATASLPPLYYNILNLPKTDRELEVQLEVNVETNLEVAPGKRVWRAGFSESGVSRNNRVVERHESQHGAYWKSYDFKGNSGRQNIFSFPLDFTHDGGEIIFNLPNGLQAYYLTTASGDRLDAAPVGIVSTGERDPVVRNGISCMGCHTEGIRRFKDQVRPAVEGFRNPAYNKAQVLRLYVEKSIMDTLINEDIVRYKQALEEVGGVFGGIEPIQQLVKQFGGPLNADYAAAEVGMETDEFLKKIRENSALQNAGLPVLNVENGTVKRDAWESEFRAVVSGLTFVKLKIPLEEALTKITFIVTDLSGDFHEEVIFEGDGVTRDSNYIHLQKQEGNQYSYYRILPQHAVEGNRYIFVPLAQGGVGSGVFWYLKVVDKKDLKSIGDVSLGDRANIKKVILADADSDTVSITYVEREVEGIYGPGEAITKHFRMIQGTLQEVEP